MMLWHITFRYIKQNLKRPITLVLLVFAPVLIIMLMVQAFAGIDAAGQTALQIHIGYYNPRGRDAVFESFAASLAGAGIIFEATSGPAAGRRQVAAGDYQALLLFDAQHLSLLVNDNSGIRAGIIESVLRSYVNQANLDHVLASITLPALENSGYTAQQDYLSLKTLDTPRQPRAIDYMGIIILTMAILLSSHLGAYTITREKILKTLNRIYTAPVKKGEFLAGVFSGVLVAEILQLGTVFLICRYFLHIYYGENILRVAILLLSECFFAIALGMGVAGLLKENKAVNGLMATLLPTLIFLGGGYMKLPDNPLLNVVSRFSPLDWINKALFEEIYSGGQSYFLPAVGICLFSSLLLLGLAARRMIRSDAL